MSRFLCFAVSFTTTTCALQGELLGLILPNSNNRLTSLLMNSRSSCEYRRDGDAIGLQSGDRCVNTGGGSMFMVELHTTSSGFSPPNSTTTFLCSPNMSVPMIMSVHKESKTKSLAFLYRVPFSFYSVTTYPLTVTANVGSAMETVVLAAFISSFNFMTNFFRYETAAKTSSANKSFSFMPSN